MIFVVTSMMLSIVYVRSRGEKRKIISVRRDLRDFVVDTVVSKSDRMVVIKGRCNEETGLVILRHVLNIRDVRSVLKNLTLTMTTSNAEYSYYNAENNKFGDVTVEVVMPASKKLIQRYESFANMRIVRESPAMYASSTAKLIREKQRDGSMNWIYAILDGNAEQELRV